MYIEDFWCLNGIGQEMGIFNAYKIKSVPSVHAEMVFNFC